MINIILMMDYKCLGKKTVFEVHYKRLIDTVANIIIVEKYTRISPDINPFQIMTFFRHEKYGFLLFQFLSIKDISY